ncbi:YitT family protein [Balneatrix alpica]|uniref:YitT family protein n=1 Tax=Balneatrix alpica TaxID=75684 RepID=A0ABV5Z9M9_9GAMM|nr:YitT family protein [Balneatrix alpica]
MYLTHRWLSILEGCLLVALGIHILNAAGLLISGTAGLGLTLQRLTSLSFGQLFFILNLPFYILALKYLGKGFTLRTFISISLLSILTELLDRYMHLQIQEPFFAAALGGMLIGFGLILLFRHQSSLGGLNILAMYLERRYGIHAGKTTLAGDVLIVILALWVFAAEQVLYSLVAFLMMSSVVGRYHRPPEWAKVPQAA